MEAPKIRLLADRVLVEVVTENEEVVTSSGIIIPTYAQDSDEKPQIGVIVAVSTRVEKCEVEADRVYVGERVIFSKFAGSPINYKGRDYKLLRITDLFGVAEE